MTTEEFAQRLEISSTDAPIEGFWALCATAAARLRALDAENARLRDALSMIAVMGFSDDLRVSANIARMAVQQARAALTPAAQHNTTPQPDRPAAPKPGPGSA